MKKGERSMKHHCIICGNRLPQKSLFTLENAPASAQNIPSSEEVKNDEGVMLGLYQCGDCGLVQFDCEPVDYYRDVIRAGGFSTTMIGLRRRQYSYMIEKYHLEGKRFIEVGCGRGEFLKVLTEFPVKVYGIEHKADLVDIAKRDGLTVWRQFPDTVEERFGSFDVFLSFNFLEHQPQPAVMLRAIYNNLSDNGMGLVTVPALEYIVEQESYYELIHDHIAYYSFNALRQLLERSGFKVLEEEMINRDTISMIVKKIPGMKFDSPIPECCEKTEDGLKKGIENKRYIGNDLIDDFELCSDKLNTNANCVGRRVMDSLLSGYEKIQTEIDDLIKNMCKSGRTIAIWGASHQGFTLVSTTKLGTYARYIIDSAPFKQGRFAPASHLPIVSPDYFYKEPVDAVMIVAPGYTEEIASSIRSKFGLNVEILTMRTNHIEKL